MLKVASIFANNMILQREVPFSIFGSSEPNNKVTVEIDRKIYETVTDPKGAWSVECASHEASRHCVIRIYDEHTDIELTNIAFGDVYLAAGQSNMEFVLQNEDHFAQAREKVKTLDIRSLRVPQIEYIGDGKDPSLRWEILDETNIEEVSAVAYYALEEISHHTNVPVGVVGCYKGGTSASCWIDEMTLKNDPFLNERFVEPYWDGILEQSEKEEDEKRLAYQRLLAEYQQKVEQYQKEFPERSLSELKHDLGHTPWPQPKGKKDFGRPGGLHDLMFERIKDLKYKAVWWYQGEEDAKNAWAYDHLLATLIESWRHELHQDVPFFLIQLPSYIEETYPETWPIIRQAQMDQVLTHEDVHILCTLDQGDAYNIHPTNKKEVGKRLGQLVSKTFYDPDLRVVYPKLRMWKEGEEGVELVFEGIDEGSIVLDLDNTKQVFSIHSGMTTIKSLAHTISYAWENNPENITFNALDLPMFPFKIELE